MNSRTSLAALLSGASIVLAGTALGACHFPGSGGGKAPTGQVVATVNGKEVTLLELRAELGNTHFTDPKQQKAAEQAALQRIIVRKLLAQAAHDQGIDKKPDFALLQQRADEALLAQSLEQNLVSQVPAPTKEEAQSFVSGHPDLFSERKIFVVDQIRMGRPNNPDLMKQIQPLNSLEAIAAVLNSNHVDFKRGEDNLDVIGMDPRMVEALIKLPPGEVFVFPRGGMVLINQIKETHISPVNGDAATNYAMQLLRAQRTQETVGRQLGAILSKSAGKVRYNAAYQPPKPAAAAAPAATPAATPAGAAGGH
jgi:EpsD family peptidyl-prolyl cis-trans isomerase